MINLVPFVLKGLLISLWFTVNGGFRKSASRKEIRMQKLTISDVTAKSDIKISENKRNCN